MDRLPEAVVALLPRGGVAVELAAGARFDLALDLAGRRPDARVLVTDAAQEVLGAPPPLTASRLDLHAAAPGPAEGAGLLFARRLPEELQPAAARLARRVGAPLAFRPLKDELADVGPVALVEGWRLLKP